MTGKTLGHYRVGEQLGSGGMGEVYVADDLSLDRKVALKFLPAAFTGDLERMARFEREAKLLASLNHPNIAGIYGLEQAEGKRFIVMELVEGETLAQRLSKGPLPLEEALGICRQIAEALEAAHEKGVIHRDLKPANVMITEGDKVKILDFGLAKALSDEAQGVDASQSPTITEAMTKPGIILGTAAYMSPEQAKGKAVDKRADIWAFGCILYECLAGKRAFEGETVTETLAAILKGEPDWNALPSTVPPNIRFVLRCCLEKDVSRRLRDTADARMLFEEAGGLEQPVTETTSPKRLWLAWGLAAVCLLIALALGFLYFHKKTPVAVEAVQLQIPLPDEMKLADSGVFSLSPDGRWLAFDAAGSDGIGRIWIRPFGSLETRPLLGTENNQGCPIFWSHDSRFLVYWTGEKLVKIDIFTGQRQSLCDYRAFEMGGSWNRDGVIVFGSNTQGVGLMQVPSAGGSPSPLTVPDGSRQESSHKYPSFLSDGRHFLYWRASRKPEYDGLYVGSLDAKPEEQSFNRLLQSEYGTIYVPSSDSGSGHLLFLREGILMSQSFDERRLELTGEPIPVAEGIGSFRDSGYFSVSTNGVLVYRSGRAEISTRAMWFDRQGKELNGALGASGSSTGLALSPDGAQAAVGIGKFKWGQGPTSGDLWLLDFARETNSRFTFGQGINWMPVWAPDGRNVIFASNRDGVYNLYQKASNGGKDEELLLKSSDSKIPSSWSSDGRFLLYASEDPKTKYDLWLLSLQGDRKPTPFLRTEFNELDGHFSPDMQWIAYTSDESGRYEIYVRGFSKAPAVSPESGKWQVSVSGGMGPRWRKDGKELYYRAPDGKVMVVQVTSGVVFHSGTPKPLFQAPADLSVSLLGFGRYTLPISFWDITSDGNRFLLTTPEAELTPAPFTVVLNWTSLLKK